LTGYLEAKVLLNAKAISIELFLKYIIFPRYGLPLIVVVNRGSKFKKEVVEILKYLGIDRVSISPYNSQVNGVNEVGYIPIIIVLAKIINGTREK
jgi:transposase InsO family protein